MRRTEIKKAKRRGGMELSEQFPAEPWGQIAGGCKMRREKKWTGKYRLFSHIRLQTEGDPVRRQKAESRKDLVFVLSEGFEHICGRKRRNQ